MAFNTLLIGGRGTIGSGLRKYLPGMDGRYRFCSIDLPGAPDRAGDHGRGGRAGRADQAGQMGQADQPGRGGRAGRDERFIDMDINEEPDRFRALLPGFDLVVYLARQGDLAAMNKMTDLVFESVLALGGPGGTGGTSGPGGTGGTSGPGGPNGPDGPDGTGDTGGPGNTGGQGGTGGRPMIVGSSSVHAVDDAYRFFESGAYALIADRKFDAIENWPDPIPAHLPACPINDYGREKAYVETWVERASARGCGATAVRWGGVNPGNSPIVEERGYFAVWCHQQDAAAMVHAAYTAHLAGRLPAGRHYFVISDNTYNIFDIETPKEEIGYLPTHNAETFFRQSSSDRRA